MEVIVKFVVKTIWLTTFLSLSFTSSPTHAQKLQQVRIALSTPTPHMTPLWVGRSEEHTSELQSQ